MPPSGRNIEKAVSNDDGKSWKVSSPFRTMLAAFRSQTTMFTTFEPHRDRWSSSRSSSDSLAPPISKMWGTNDRKRAASCGLERGSSRSSTIIRSTRLGVSLGSLYTTRRRGDWCLSFLRESEWGLWRTLCSQCLPEILLQVGASSMGVRCSLRPTTLACEGDMQTAGYSTSRCTERCGSDSQVWALIDCRVDTSEARSRAFGPTS